ncbi:MAG: hypothetical protein ACEY3M_22020 [Wolbachia sp.]
MNTIKIRKTSYLEHILQHEEYEQLQIILKGKVEGKRGIGRKTESWLRNIKEWRYPNTVHREEYATIGSQI